SHKGIDSGGGPIKWFLPGYDELHVRFYVKFDPNYHYLHHFVGLSANKAGDQWSAFGMAGCKPTGSNFFTTNLEPNSNWGASAPPGAWTFYSYFPDMSCDPGSRCSTYADPVAICNQCASRGSPCSNGPECCWGNIVQPSTPIISQLGRWYCMEMMVRTNTSG